MKIKRLPVSAFVIYGIWIALIMGGFVYLTWMKETKTDVEEVKTETNNKLMDETE